MSESASENFGLSQPSHRFLHKNLVVAVYTQFNIPAAVSPRRECHSKLEKSSVPASAPPRHISTASPLRTSCYFTPKKPLDGTAARASARAGVARPKSFDQEPIT
eukprot:TRINITY_DN76091_c0_g1_i1.p2 TRINITY_DN76091_c0_g1~~TRINITY_DN76091_c0_g1_i1.p2  ORF type:complete len:115 (-),score=12.49 TRINITY_DN76091_c0_g1_i1:199-513(-)